MDFKSERREAQRRRARYAPTITNPGYRKILRDRAASIQAGRIAPRDVDDGDHGPHDGRINGLNFGDPRSR